MVICRSKSEIAKIRRACDVVSGVLAEVRRAVNPGRTTRELDRVAEEYIISKGAFPAFKGYRGYPASICTSVNQQVVHGIPSDYALQAGDILGIDAGAVLDGYYGDAAITVPVGDIDGELINLLQITRAALMKGIDQARPGRRVFDISHAVQQHVESNGYSVVRDFVGHGIGTHLHEDPQVPNYGEPGKGKRLVEGMVLAIEPMVNTKGFEVKTLSDNWTVITADGGYSAHFEHSVAILSDGPAILTEWD
ncbi:MAG: type I methionyl aminopeptidase [Acidobacteria bacterium]|nr:type I methionyl aminopeptidase [Acidobacteriota bacterium]MBI3657639.1 type I methionyl aminopeptidase [Acidobacteriota bacterium]